MESLYVKCVVVKELKWQSTNICVPSRMCGRSCRMVGSLWICENEGLFHEIFRFSRRWIWKSAVLWDATPCYLWASLFNIISLVLVDAGNRFRRYVCVSVPPMTIVQPTVFNLESLTESSVGPGGSEGVSVRPSRQSTKTGGGGDGKLNTSNEKKKPGFLHWTDFKLLSWITE
jgi:hypothetical protein